PEHGAAHRARALLEARPGAVELREERDREDPPNGAPDTLRRRAQAFVPEMDRKPRLARGGVELPDGVGVAVRPHVLPDAGPQRLEDLAGPTEIALGRRLFPLDQPVLPEPPRERPRAGRERVPRPVDVVVYGEERANELQIPWRPRGRVRVGMRLPRNGLHLGQDTRRHQIFPLDRLRRDRYPSSNR